MTMRTGDSEFLGPEPPNADHDAWARRTGVAYELRHSQGDMGRLYRARVDAYRMRDNDERRARYEAAEAERRASAAAFAAENERLRVRLEAADARHRAALAAERKCDVI